VGKVERRSLAFVLRLWRATNSGPPVWRAALMDLRTGERRGFPGLAEAVRYLEGQMEGQERGPTDGGLPGSDEPGEDVERR
jgi:hypothetical protein